MQPPNLVICVDSDCLLESNFDDDLCSFEKWC